MVKFFVIIFLSTISISLFGYSFKGSWESDFCESYNDSLSYGKFVYIFTDDYKIQTYIQFYQGDKCLVKTSRLKQATGSYKAKETNPSHYTVSVKYDHLRRTLYLKIIFVSDTHFKMPHGNHYHSYYKIDNNKIYKHNQ